MNPDLPPDPASDGHGPHWPGVAVGATVAGVALLVSIASYGSASTGGGTYVVLWGAVLWGAWKALTSLLNEDKKPMYFKRASNPDEFINLTQLAKTHRAADNAILLEAYRTVKSLDSIEWFEREAPHAVFSRLDCPTCGLPLNRPKAIGDAHIEKVGPIQRLFRLCPRCQQRIYFRRGSDGRTHLLGPDELRAEEGLVPSGSAH